MAKLFDPPEDLKAPISGVNFGVSEDTPAPIKIKVSLFVFTYLWVRRCPLFDSVVVVSYSTVGMAGDCFEAKVSSGQKC